MEGMHTTNCTASPRALHASRVTEGEGKERHGRGFCMRRWLSGKAAACDLHAQHCTPPNLDLQQTNSLKKKFNYNALAAELICTPLKSRLHAGKSPAMARSGSWGPDAALPAVFLGRGGEVEEEWVQRHGRELVGVGLAGDVGGRGWKQRGA